MVYIYNLIQAPTTFQIIFKIMAAVFVYCTHTTRILPYWRKNYFGRSIWKRKSNSVKQWSSRRKRKTGNVLVCCPETKVTLLNSEQWWLFKFKDVLNPCELCHGSSPWRVKKHSLYILFTYRGTVFISLHRLVLCWVRCLTVNCHPCTHPCTHPETPLSFVSAILQYQWSFNLP